MNDEIKIPEIKTDIPNYPNWKNGMKWGFIISLPVFAMFLIAPTSERPVPPMYILMAINLLSALFFAGIVFLSVCLIVACRPIKKKKDN